jgi:catechol 2,3-dioxygenase-like lactoylglutathione lyase family enzyme
VSTSPTGTAAAVEVLRFDHAGLSVADLDRSHRFYADVLGFDRVEDEFSLPAHEIRGRVLLNPAGVRIELFERRGSQPIRRGHPTEGALQQGWFQFALATQDIQASWARVVAAGATPLLAPRIAPDGRSWVAFVGDPDGNLVELLQRSAGT